MTQGYYAADGSMNITVVDGTSYTGLYAVDGSFNVVSSVNNTTGAQHPCGAIWVTNNTSNVNTLRAADGSLNISQSPYYSSTQPTTIVNGGFTPGTGALVPLLVF